jgi:2-methylaconitate cis-trans-isomerase PrpF
MVQRKISAACMRGGTSKGVFFKADAPPADPGYVTRSCFA